MRGIHISGLTTDSMCFRADVVHRTIHHGLAQDSFDLIGQRHILVEVNGLAAVLFHQIEAVLVVVADNDA